MILLYKNCRAPQGWYELMVCEKTEELISQLNQYDEGKQRCPAKLFKLIEVICSHPEYPEMLTCSYDDLNLLIYKNNELVPFIEIEFQA